jgi:nucleoside-diphosphate-sugar epimerase
VYEERPVTVFGDGQQSRDFTYVDDIARGCIAALHLPGYEVINLGSDEPVGLMDALHMIEELTGKQAKIEYHPRHSADVLHTWADIGKAERLLNWRPQTKLADGIGQLVAWYRENREWASGIQV